MPQVRRSAAVGRMKASVIHWKPSVEASRACCTTGRATETPTTGRYETNTPRQASTMVAVMCRVPVSGGSDDGGEAGEGKATGHLGAVE
ncbi:hypothetical protein ACFY0P_08185 [Streptomyces sp. NPDC001714]|uniref:hypothetical protein n=1 Tax=Streptomyces sp. NPDC001714 TaxID=3364603 RepID=UPI003682ECC9